MRSMKKLFLTCALIATAFVATAGEEPTRPSWSGFVTNGFWDNWEVSVGLGAGTAFTSGTNAGSFGERLGFEGNVSALKWITPVAGLRAQLQGGKFGNFDSELGKARWPYLFAHVDLTLNVSNWIGGYRDDRVYYAVPFVGFGYMASSFTDEIQSKFATSAKDDFAVTYGILNKFRVSPAFDINLELKAFITHSQICPAATDGSILHGVSATAGVTYRFNHRGWERGVAGFTQEHIDAFQQAVADGNARLEEARAENDRLNRELEAAKADALRAEAAAKAAEDAAATAAARELNPNPMSVIFYDYSMSKLTAKEKTRLLLMADVIKNGPKDRVYKIQGHADKQTGTPAGNKRVAENRAKNVYDFLVANGVNPKQLTYEGLGDSQSPYGFKEANRSVIIK